MLRFWTLALLLAGLLGAPDVARAQLPDAPTAPSEEDVLQARDAFLRGMEFAGERRFEAARREFVHSYALSGSPVALFNLASTLRSLDRHRDAAEAFERLLANPDLEASVRQQAAPMYDEVRREVGRLRLHGELDGATLRLDRDPPRALGGDSVTIVVEPGAHDLTAERAGAEPWRWSGAVAAGASLDLLVELDPLADEAPTGGDGPDPGILAAVVASSAVALIIVGVIVGAVADAEAQLDPRTDLVLELP